MTVLFSKGHELEGKYGERVPTGQGTTGQWPLLHCEQVPEFDLARWKFRAFDEIEEELECSCGEFPLMPTV